MCYADRGLVKNGSVNLRLAKILYCVWLFTVTSIPLAIFPVSQHLKSGAEFPDHSFKGRICQEKSLESFLGSEKNTFIGNLRQRFLTLVGNAIAIIYSLSLAFRIKTFVDECCLLF